MITNTDIKQMPITTISAQMRKTALPVLSLLLATAGIFLVFERIGIACVEPNRPSAFLKIEGVPGESTDDKHKEWIEVVSPYSTVSVNQPTNCAIAIAHSGKLIESVEEVTVVLASTGMPIFNFRRESSNTVCKAFFGDPEFQPCNGFLASVIPPVSGGQNVEIRIRLRLKFEATAQELRADLLSERIGTDEANADGTLKGSNRHIVGVSDITIAPPLTMGAPMLTDYGLIALMGLVLMSGLIFIMKSQRKAGA